MNNVEGYIWEWTTEVPQYKNGDRGMFCGGSAVGSTSWDIASYRIGHYSATVDTHSDVDFRLASLHCE